MVTKTNIINLDRINTDHENIELDTEIWILTTLACISTCTVSFYKVDYDIDEDREEDEYWYW